MRLFVAIVVGVIALVTVAQQIGRFGPWWFELSRYLPYVIVLVPAIAAVLMSLWLGRGWFAASVAALLLVLTTAMGFEWHDGDAGDVRLRFMTYNIKAYKARWSPTGFSMLAAEVAQHQPDILVMQDARQLIDKDPDEGGPAPGPVFGLPNVYAISQYVVASRYPLRDCGVGKMGRPGDEHRYVRCTVTVSGVDLHIVTAHFESPRTGLNAARHEGLNGLDDWRDNYEQRLAQSANLRRDLAGAPRPMILAGDLNAPESSPVLRNLLSMGLRDAFSSAGRGYGFSYGHTLRLGFSFLRIDHVLVSPEIGVADCFVGGSAASDHRPVIADLWLHRR